jgi:beta propeller repeat protein
LSQKKNKVFGILALAILSLTLMSGPNMLCPVSAAGFELREYQVTTSTASQEYPDISKWTVVYQDNRNGNWDIYLSDVGGTTPIESRLTTNSGNQMAPAINGSLVVYQDNRNGNWDIYLYNLTSQTETRITTNTASQTNPDIENNNIIWQDNRNGNWDIYLYDLSSRLERRVTTSSSDEQNPAISGNLLVYDKSIMVGNLITTAVFSYNIASNVETQVSNSGDANSNPSIYGRYVLYQSGRASELDTLHLIEMRNLVNSSDNWEGYDGYNPDISENYAVYEDHGGWTVSGNDIIYNSNIMLLNLDTKIKNQITGDTKDHLNPKISGGRMVYMDNRNGNWDIYMTVMVMAQAGPTPTPPTRVGAAGPGSTQSGSEDSSLSLSNTLMIAAIVVIAVVIASISIALFYKKHKSLTTKKNQETD